MLRFEKQFESFSLHFSTSLTEEIHGCYSEEIPRGSSPPAVQLCIRSEGWSEQEREECSEEERSLLLLHSARLLLDQNLPGRTAQRKKTEASDAISEECRANSNEESLQESTPLHKDVSEQKAN